MSEKNEQAVRALWDALIARDWDALRGCVSENTFYEDVPTPDSGARGPDAIIKRLRIAFDHIKDYEHVVHRIVGSGDSVFVEHTETWRFETGESATNPFVTVHEVRDGEILLWRDYWDVASFTSQFPPWFLEKLASHAGQEFND